MAKIVSVYTDRDHELVNMSYIRWYKMSEALARYGHGVDIGTNKFMAARQWRKNVPSLTAGNLRRVPLAKVSWKDYDVVKTSYREGFDRLEKYGGRNHPFIISRCGTVVGRKDLDGIYFSGKRRRQLYR